MLVGAKETVARFQPVILIELVHDHLIRAGDTLDSAWELLTGWGYAPKRWTAGTNLEPLTDPWEGDSIWLPPETNP
jgi:hypothetical protein